MCYFFFNDTATTEIYTLSLHDALPISSMTQGRASYSMEFSHYDIVPNEIAEKVIAAAKAAREGRSEEHTSELQSRLHLVCRLLLEKKNIVHFDKLDPMMQHPWIDDISS